MYRDYKDPLYKAFRQAVRKRDKHKCRWIGCCKKKDCMFITFYRGTNILY